MQTTLKAIYEKGVFRPLEKLELAEGQSVQLIVDTNPLTPQEMLQLAFEVYEGLSETDINEIEEM
jgi:predicted DNA-binding antitoxin AbrB/MazE fold protein